MPARERPFSALPELLLALEEAGGALPPAATARTASTTAASGDSGPKPAAITRAPRSCPSKPGLATSTRIRGEDGSWLAASLRWVALGIVSRQNFVGGW